MSPGALPHAPAIVRSAYHHGTHRPLLSQVSAHSSFQSTVDAIVVPTARSSDRLRHATELAATLGCPLVVLCSRDASAQAAVRQAKGRRVDVIAVDTDRLPTSLMPGFATTELLADTCFQRHEDLSLKRNFALLFAAVAGWSRIVFLDDDIRVPRADDLREAAGLLDRHDVVGLSPAGFPDNSVVCHAYREAGGQQETFVGGGALAVSEVSFESFFPRIYNEDWFFLLNRFQLRSTAMIGTAVQEEFDPFASTERAVSEELGDCLAEGLFWLLDRQRQVVDADEDFWWWWLGNRRLFIGEVMDLVSTKIVELDRRTRMISALKPALDRSELIKPYLCVEFLSAWRGDCGRWQRHLAQFRRAGGFGPEKAIADLGLAGCSEYMLALRR